MAVDLCQLSDVKTALQKTDTASDAILQALIDRASAAILKYTGREFAPVTANATRTFAYLGSGILDLAPYDLQSVTSIVQDTETASPVTLTTDQYALRPKPNPDGTYQWIQLLYREFESEVQVTGTWGFPSLPVDVTHATVITAMTWFRRENAAFTTVYNETETPLNTPIGIPYAAKSILDQYKRLRVG